MIVDSCDHQMLHVFLRYNSVYWMQFLLDICLLIICSYMVL